MKVQSYKDMTVELMHATEYPAEVVGLALSITMKSDPASEIKPLSLERAKFILDADHTSVLEHINYCFLLQGISRSLLAQLTRHRMSSFTSGSQHYQDYSDYPMSVHPALQEEPVVVTALENAMYAYQSTLAFTKAPEEARQVLPNAATVTVLWTVNARSLVNFLKLRLCYRNVTEMRLFAERVRKLLVAHFPELFEHVGPQCFMETCKQGPMTCGMGPWQPLVEENDTTTR